MPITPPTATFPDAGNKVIRLSDVYWQLSRSLIQIRDELFSMFKSADGSGDWRFPNEFTPFPWDAEYAFSYAARLLEADFNHLDELGGWRGHIYTASAPFKLDYQDRAGGGFNRHESAFLDGLRNNLYAAALGQTKARRSGRWKSTKGQLTDKRYIRVPFK